MIDNNDVGRDPRRVHRARQGLRASRAVDLDRSTLPGGSGTTFSPLLWIRLAAWVPLLSKPDTQYHYSNIGYEILGLIAARTAGEPLSVLYRDRIAKPLGLTSAAYDPQGDIAGPHPVGYSVDAKGKPVAATAWGTGGIGAEGGIVASARDEARFLVALMQGKLLKPAQLTALKTVPRRAPTSYGLGTDVDPSGCAGTAYGHNGGGAAFSSSVFVSGDGKRVAVLLVNGRAADGSSDTAVYAAMNKLYCKA